MSEIAHMRLRFPVAFAASLLLFLALTGCGPAEKSMTDPDVPSITVEDPAQWVDPFIGTDRMGHTYPGATATARATNMATRPSSASPTRPSVAPGTAISATCF